MFAPVYLDHNATTPLDSRVFAAMLPYLETQFGNPSSRHEYGRAARRAIDLARQQVAQALDAEPGEIFFCSGGSEANALFIKGLATGIRTPAEFVTSTVEHPCVSESARQLVKAGWQMRALGVDSNGWVRPSDMEHLLEVAKPLFCSVMLANNETGVIQPVAELAGLVRQKSKAWFHTDAVQAFGKIPLSFRELNRTGVHAMTVSAHKLGGPKGAAALVLDKRVELLPLIAGGGQEKGLRSGTENVAAIVGFGAACALLASSSDDSSRLADLRNHLETGLSQLEAIIFGQGVERLPNTCFFAVPGLDGETLVAKLDRCGFAVASGAACSSMNLEGSETLRSMGVPADLLRGAVRVSLGKETSLEDIEQFLKALTATVSELRNLVAVIA